MDTNNNDTVKIKNKRMLASVRAAKEINPIEGADIIVAVKIDGWKCVCGKDDFKNPGELGVYFEIDSFLPLKDPRYAFLSREAIEFEGEQGVCLRTRKFKGQVAQGLFLPLRSFPELVNAKEGDDVSEVLGIKKWEAPIPAQLSGIALGSFPSHTRRTDQERIQNLEKENEENQGRMFEVTIKLDGSSMTVYRHNDRVGVCSKNLELKETEENSLWRVARKQKIIEGLNYFGKNYSIQGEIVGEGIQHNKEGLKGHDFYIFDIFDIDNYTYLKPEERLDFVKKMQENGFPVKHVPFLKPDQPMIELRGNVDELLEMANGPSMNPAVTREGLVWKRDDGQYSFKTISNQFLLLEEKRLEKENKKSRNKMK